MSKYIITIPLLPLRNESHHNELDSSIASPVSEIAASSLPEITLAVVEAYPFRTSRQYLQLWRRNIIGNDSDHALKFDERMSIAWVKNVHTAERVLVFSTNSSPSPLTRHWCWTPTRARQCKWAFFAPRCSFAVEFDRVIWVVSDHIPSPQFEILSRGTMRISLCHCKSNLWQRACKYFANWTGDPYLSPVSRQIKWMKKQFLSQCYQIQ